jgi:hypothetical protein
LEVGIDRLDEKIDRLSSEEAQILQRLPSNDRPLEDVNKQQTLPSLQSTMSSEEGADSLKNKYLAEFEDIRSGLVGLSQARPQRDSSTDLREED